MKKLVLGDGRRGSVKEEIGEGFGRVTPISIHPPASPSSSLSPQSALGSKSPSSQGLSAPTSARGRSRSPSIDTGNISPAADIIGDTGSLLSDIMDVLEQRSEELGKSIYIVCGYLSSRVAQEVTHYKTTYKNARMSGAPLKDLVGDGVYRVVASNLFKLHERECQQQVDTLSRVQVEVIDPVLARLHQHERTCKSLMEKYRVQRKESNEVLAELDRLRAKYYAAGDVWLAALQEKTTEENSVYRMKLGKRTKLEEETKAKLQALEDAVRTQLAIVNDVMSGFRRQTLLTSNALERSLLETEEAYKESLSRYTKMQLEGCLTARAIIDMVTTQLRESNSKEFLARFVQKMSKGQVWSSSQLTLEPVQAPITTDAAPAAEADKPASSPQGVRLGMHSFKKTSKSRTCHQCGRLAVKPIQCIKCNLVCHKRCAEKAALDCDTHSSRPPPLARDLSFFGVALTRQPLHMSTQLPFVVETCIDFVEKRGINKLGLYRVAGVKSSVEKLSGIFEAAVEPIVLDDDVEIHAVTGCLKLFLRELPESTLFGPGYEALLKLASAKQLDAAGVRSALELLPAVHQTLFKTLVQHFARIVANSEVNKMTALNLSVVFGPTLTPQSSPLEAIAFNNAIVEFAIVNSTDIFGEDPVLTAMLAPPVPEAPKLTPTQLRMKRIAEREEEARRAREAEAAAKNEATADSKAAKSEPVAATPVVTVESISADTTAETVESSSAESPSLPTVEVVGSGDDAPVDSRPVISMHDIEAGADDDSDWDDEESHSGSTVAISQSSGVSPSGQPSTLPEPSIVINGSADSLEAAEPGEQAANGVDVAVHEPVESAKQEANGLDVAADEPAESGKQAADDAAEVKVAEPVEQAPEIIVEPAASAESIEITADI